MRPRRANGTSLIETLVIIAIGGIIATLAIKLLHQSQLNTRQAQDWLDLQTGVTRLETQFRRDLRDATEVEIPDEKTLVIQRQDFAVTYKIKTGLVERALTLQGSDQVQREGYRMPKSSIVFTRDDDSGRVRVLIEAKQGFPASEAYVIEQAIGRRP